MNSASAGMVLAASLLPALGVMGLLVSVDKKNPGPRNPLGKMIFIGFLGVIPAFLLELVSVPLADLAPLKGSLLAKAFAGIALPEETVKGALLLGILQKRSTPPRVRDVLTSALAVAAGFALFENIIYVISAEDPFALALLRGFTALPLHLLTGGLMGLALGGRERKYGSRFFPALFLAVLIHGLYNIILMEPRIPSGTILPFLLLGFFFLDQGLRRSRNKEKDIRPPSRLPEDFPGS